MKKSHWGDKGAPGPERDRTTVKIEDLMAQPVMTVTRHQTVGHAREMMKRHGIHSIPVVDSEGDSVGIVTSTDLMGDHAEGTKLGLVMTRDVMRVSRFASPHVAARVMRKHRIHHLVVTNERRVVGIVSSFDLLALIEDKRYAVRTTVKGSKSKKNTEKGSR